MLKIRLRRTGQKHQPSYRIVVADKDSPRDGRFVEILGHYNPRTEPVTFEVKADRVQHWVSQGAQPTETVHRLLHARGIIETEPPKRVTKPSKAEREAAAKAEADAKAAAEAKAAEEAAAAKAAEEAAAASAEGEAEEASSDE
ncbi:MAG: 30S ribosomal protein S16 [Dehalococcoidia bacterium]|nr:30S ribosomal protein S16 [Dehalococcoidia bacterium]MCA9851282.1 30S ribosomal protein S16 [Dehalococcoidia bacterium]MCA9857024.1 30S ribosomal protein S16 [Dehalococcoidia bacterium]MCB9483339.1 30S ribosomal protein S16 [Dehalococcoidia bacterium]MCB9492157.1 30S ribosomal protein S16 [Dehalococcoidia bacterium]